MHGILKSSQDAGERNMVHNYCFSELVCRVIPYGEYLWDFWHGLLGMCLYIQHTQSVLIETGI